MSDAVSRLNAALEGRYSIERELGEGGMATVYLAEDIKHERKVALKVLKPELAAVVGGERFLAEIKTTANLQHPHILALFDSGEADGFVFYVMPFVEGESLRDRLDREKQLGVKDAVAIARKVADALDYAHEHGVVHRDIKPGNILLSERGEPLVADFGIALAVAHAGAGRITETGLSLGTPHYMSPEQATGDRDVDPRSDVFALGSVLYEMLAGEPPFAAPTAQAVLVKILTSDAAPITRVRRTVPPHVDSALTRALEKLPADRFGSAAEFATALGDESFTYQAQPSLTPIATPEPIAQTPVAATRPWYRDRRVVAAVLVAAVTSTLAAWGWLGPRGSTSEAPALRTILDLGEVAMSSILAEVRISPDGSRFAFAGDGPDGTRAIYHRSAVDMTFRPIPDTEGDVSVVTFSPDSEWLAYVDGGGGGPVMKVSLLGGAPTTVMPAGTVSARLIDWGAEGWIVFWGAEPGGTGLYRVPDTGGSVQKLVSEPWVTMNPRLLPDGSGVLFTDQRTGVVALYDVEADSVITLLPSGIDATYVESGHIVYVDASGGLWAAPFDLARRELTGEAKPVLQGVTTVGELWGRYSVSRGGTLVYGMGGQLGSGSRSQRELAVVTLDGTSRTVELARRRFSLPRWSPDGRFIAYEGIGVAERPAADDNIYVYDVDLETAPRRLTNEGDNGRPVWSPDGRRLVFSSNRDGADGLDLFVRAVDDDIPAELLLSFPGNQSPMDWPEDDLLLFETANSDAGAGLWLAELSDSVQVREYYAPEANVDDPRVSPDGTLAVYVSNESERSEVYLRSFPEPRAETLVSERGGRSPLWSLDGTSIYYLNLARDSLITVRLQREPLPAVTSREAIPWQGISDLDLHPAGDRFIGVQAPNPVGDDDAEALEEHQIVIVNWFEELRQRMGN